MPDKIIIHMGAAPEKRTPPPTVIKGFATLSGKTVFFRRASDSPMVAGVVTKASRDTDDVEVALCLPNSDGVLVMSRDSRMTVKGYDVVEVEAVTNRHGDVRSFEQSTTVKSMAETIRDEHERVVDYKDVKFDGFASTFQETTPEDRDGDYIMQGAFSNSLKRFKENPVLLIDHARSVSRMMGSYSKVSIGQRGLEVTGNLTNSLFAEAIHTRALVAEGHLKTLSIGGGFFYEDDYRGIREVNLMEISLVVVPANPDALIQVRSLDITFTEKAFKQHARMNGGEVRLKMG